MLSLFQERRWWIAVVLGLIGLAANAFPIELFFRVDFIFGSVASLLALSLLGIGPGLLATAIAASYTIVLWGHPYAFLIFLAEAAFVAAVIRWKSTDLILADAAYWLIAGMWLVLGFYRVGMGVEMPGTVLVMLKQAVNGILNAFLAALLRLLLSSRFPQISRQRLTVHQWLTIPVAGLVLLPAVLLTILESRSEIRNLEQLASQRLELSIRNAQDHFNYIYDRRLDVLGAMAQQAEGENGGFRPVHELQEQLRVAKTLFPEFHNFYVANERGTAIAFYPERNVYGEPNVGASFEDRPYFQELTNTLKPVISEVFMGRAGVFVPIQTINVPIVQEGRFVGYVSGALDLSWMQSYLRREAEGSDLELQLIDKAGRIVASTLARDEAFAQLDIDLRTLEQRSTPSLYLLPPRENVPQLIRNQRSWYLSHGLLSAEVPSLIVAKVPVGPYMEALNRAYIYNLSLALGLTSAFFLLVRLVVSRFSQPFIRLAELTRDVPKKLADGTAIEWPAVPILEFEKLISNLRGMTSALQRTFSEAESKATQLSKANEELLKEINHRSRTEEFLRDQNAALLELARTRNEAGSYEEALQQIARVSARVLKVSRVSFWFYDEARSKIVCRELFETSSNQHSSGVELLASRYPSYFAALNTERVIAAHDAVSDPRTAEFGPDYLQPLGISSMLDAPIWFRGRMVGVVCHEHIGSPRHWSAEEGTFAGAIADVVTLALEEHERKQAQDALARSEENYRLMVDTAREGIWLVDANYTTTYVNSRMAELLGYEPAEMLGKQVSDFVFEEDWPALQRRVAERKQGLPGHYDFRYRRKDGSEVWVLSSTSPM
ncbi:MAG: PAS domain S-box protein, partial [Limisphaerales bacterium]